MSGRGLRAWLAARVEELGYQRLDQRGQEDSFSEPETGHRVTVVPYPRWGRRVDILTVESSLPLPEGGRTVAFRLDVGTQVHPQGAAVPERWNAQRVQDLCEAVVLPYLRRVRSADDILAMLIAGDVRPVGAGSSSASVLQHGYFLAKWWQLTDRIPDLRDVAGRLPAAERVAMQHAPWGRTELAEVMWFGRDLPPAPERLPWGPGDQGDPRAECWFRHASRSEQLREAAAAGDETAVALGQVQRPRHV